MSTSKDKKSNFQKKTASVDDLHLGRTKINNRHLERLAIIYVRQSSPQQIIEHKESTALQYALVDRAIHLGWSKDRVLVIDEDQGRSAQSAEGRFGFQKLLADISLDHVGLVLGIEMSRLARSCKDWHQLLELCALFQVLLSDQDGLYDPTNYNDRLLLGLKGTMSEAELHILRCRMNQGRLNKAKRGELFHHSPIGYIKNASGEIVLDPDEQSQNVIRLIFKKFKELGSINALLQYMVRNQIQMGVRPHFGPNRGRLEWRRPSRATLQNLLNHPIYAGAYRYGHRPIDPKKKIPGRPSTGRTIRSVEECLVLIKDKLPAYISWKQFEWNRNQLRKNRARAEAMGSAREGPALLSGLIICGKCGCRMIVSYPGRGKIVRYVCMRDCIDYGAPRCQSLKGNGTDELVSQQIFKVLEPASVELSLASARNIEKEHSRLKNHWQQRIERTQYESDRAARQYHAVEPENRLVARSLEQQWERSLEKLRVLEEEYRRFQNKGSFRLKEADRDKILKLASDIPLLWQNPKTTPADRQKIIRLLLQHVIVTVEDDTENVKVQLHWMGDYVTFHELRRPVQRYDQLKNYKALTKKIVELHDQGMWPKQIAEQLNREGWRPPKRRSTFNRMMVRQLLNRFRKSRYRPHAVKTDYAPEKNEWWLEDLARELKMPQPTLYSWMKKGWINYKQLEGKQGRLVFFADSCELNRLRKLRIRPRTWSNENPPKELITPKKLCQVK